MIVTTSEYPLNPSKKHGLLAIVTHNFMGKQRSLLQAILTHPLYFAPHMSMYPSVFDLHYP